MRVQPAGPTPSRILGRRFDPVAALLFAIGVLSLLWVSRLDFLRQDANWDLLNYHAYVPSALLGGAWFSDIHAANIQTYLTPYQDLLVWPLISEVPAPIATAVLVALQVSIFIPAGLILHIVVPRLSLSRALAVGLIGGSGAMMMTELGGTMGDIPPAILVAWALYLLLSVLAGQTLHAERRALLAGVLVGAAVALKYTVACLAPGLVVVAVALMIAGKQRCSWLFLLASPVVAVILCAPWALVLQSHMGSPVFPLFNAIFQAPRYPLENLQDSRFPVTSLGALVTLPIGQALGTAFTAELPFRDVRWVIAASAAGLGIGAWVLRSWRRGIESEWRTCLPGMALLMFWCVSYVTWALVFGIQRYAVLLEVLALPVIAAGVCLAWPRLPSSRISLPILILLAALLAGTTEIIDFGRRPMGSAPIVPAETIGPLTRYDAIVVGADPLAFLRAVTRDAPGSSSQVWLGAPFDDADRLVEEAAIVGRSVGVVFYSYQRDEAIATAASLGLRLTDDCTSFESPISNSLGLSTVEVCSASPSPCVTCATEGARRSRRQPQPPGPDAPQSSVAALDGALARKPRWCRSLVRT